MSDVKWTKEQKSAIYEKGNNLLVAAAAGSGKTAVLVERIINKIINENIDIDKLLVVTFTNAAASEMRERILDAIYNKIEENPNDIKLQRQINLLNKADICTIHSFCLKVIRNYFYELDISANFRIADTSEIELLKQDVLEDLFEEKYINHDKSFLTLINTYTSYRGDEPLKELILKIYNYIQSNPFPRKWLEEKTELFNTKNSIDKDFSQTIWGKILIQEFKNEILQNRTKLESIKHKMENYIELDKFTTTIYNDIDKLDNILLDLNDENVENVWDTIFKDSNQLKFDIWPRDSKCTMDLKEEAKKVRDVVKKDIDSIKKKIFVYDSYNANKDIYSMYDILSKLKDLVNEFEERFTKRKKEKNIIDFHDIEHYALNILLQQDAEGNFSPSEVAKKIREQYIEIAIDEYQDSNLVQEYILNSISNGKNIFMVGDIKQSIYRFRQARPKLFIDKYEQYKLVNDEDEEDLEENTQGKKIQLFKNFRSRENILDLTNIVFEQIMSKELGEIDYTQDEYLNLGANFEEPDEKTNIVGKAELHIIDLADKEDNDIWIDETTDKENEEDINRNELQEPVENVLVEANFVANKIQELVNSNYMVYDKKIGYRKVTYKDIVILLRKTADIAPVYEKSLLEKNVPVFSDSSVEYLDSIEIQTIMNVLRIIDNPMQDIPLITVLRSSIANFTDNELVEIRLADKSENFYTSLIKARLSVNEELQRKINTFFELLTKWKKDQEIYSLAELIWQIYMDSNYYNYVGLLNNGKLRQANLRMLFEKAKQYENASFKGLYNFINFIDKIKTGSKDMQSAKIIGENDNVVRIMSIHKSKGLEFPIVFLCGTAKQFNMQDLNENILLHQDFGFGPKYINYERRIEYNTLAKESIRIKLRQESISEEMRILYVALTRAKEKLFITGVSKDHTKSNMEKQELLQMYNEEKINTNLLKKYRSYLDWLELVIINNRKKMKPILEIHLHKYKDLNNVTDNMSDNNESDLIQQLNKECEKYTNQDTLKNISNSLKWNYRYISSVDIPTKTSVSQIKARNNKTENNTQLNQPNFLKEEKITAAQKGTLMHLCLKYIDETKDYDYKSITQMINEMKNKNMITQQEENAISVNTILQFTKSNLFNELKNAKEVYKEQPFYINIPAKEIYDVETDEKVLVQGIIDLYFIDKDGKTVLVDYKTDYVEDENELIDKYEEQLKIYKQAIEKTLSIKVEKTLIYSLKLQKEIYLKI